MGNLKNSKPRVLYIDDGKEYIVLFKNLLNKEYEIFTALSGKEGLEILEKESIQVVISDQRMPEMTGEELLEKVAEEYPDILRFMISGFTDFEAVVGAVNKGQIQAYFHKPIEPEEIKNAINKGLEIAYLKRKNSEILQKLESTNLALKSADRNKTFFLQILSKELGTPLNELRATVQVFKNKTISEELKNLVNLLDQNVSKFELLSSLANQLTLLKTNNGMVNVEDLNTTEVIENLFLVVSEKFKKRKINMDIIEDPKNLFFMGEFNLVISCLDNIIDNSLDQTSDEGKISIRTGSSEGMVYFEVIDEGINSTEEYIKTTSDFFSTNKELNDVNVNLNLGLVLAKQIMDAHRGRIECQCSKEEGHYKLFFHAFQA